MWSAATNPENVISPQLGVNALQSSVYNQALRAAICPKAYPAIRCRMTAWLAPPGPYRSIKDTKTREAPPNTIAPTMTSRFQDPLRWRVAPRVETLTDNHP